MAGTETMRQFCIRKGFSSAWFYQKAAGWKLEREKMRENAVKKVESKLVDYYGSYIEQTKKLLSSISNQFAKALSNTIRTTPDGQRTIVPMDADKLNSMAAAISTNVKTLRLIEGKSTENKAVKVSNDLNELLVQLQEAMEKEDEDTLGDA